MAPSRRRILILYGSETGNAQEKAEEIDRLCQRLRFDTELEELNDIKLNTLLLDFSLVIFVVSTTGQGQFPRNALAFWKSLRRAKLPPNCLSSVQFTVFGLGDSSYQKFNWASRLLRSRLLHLGAEEAFDRGEADERHEDGIDSIFQPWVKNLREHLLSTFPLPASVDPIPADQPLPPRYSLRIVPKAEAVASASKPEDDSFAVHVPEGDASVLIANGETTAAPSHVSQPQSRQERPDEDLVERARRDFESASISPDGSRTNVLNKADVPKDAFEGVDFPKPMAFHVPGTSPGKVISNTRVTPSDHWQDVRLLTLEVAIPISDDKEYFARPGDVLVLYPQNYPSDVQRLIDIMGWGAVADARVEFSNGLAPKGFFLQEGATLRDILTNNTDFTAVPTRMFLEKLADFATNEDQKEKLLELVQPEFSNEFYDFTSRPHRTILEVLAEFSSAKIPVANVPDMFPVIRGREYSIANGGRHWDKTVAGANKEEPRLEQSGNSAQSRPETDIPLQIKTVVYRFELLVALVEYRTIIRKPRQGLCSHYVKHLPTGTKLRVGIRNQTPPPSGSLAAKRPLIAIATGTGIAPIRSLIEDRSLHVDAAETLLFFGCRNQAADFYFREEWERTPNLTIIPAFSRDPKAENKDGVNRPQILEGMLGNTAGLHLQTAAGLPPPEASSPGQPSNPYEQGKTYVQHMVKRFSRKVSELLAQDAIICLCGNSGQMPKSVREALRDAAIAGGFCENEAEVETRIFSDKAGKKVTFWEETW